MKSLRTIAHASILSLSHFTSSSAVTFVTKATVFDPGRRVVLTAPGYSSINTTSTSSQLVTLLNSWGLLSISLHNKGGSTSDSLYVRPDGVTVKCPRLDQYIDLVFEEPVSPVTFQSALWTVDSNLGVSYDRVIEADTVPNDPLLSSQWPFGPDTLLNAANIRAIRAWDYNRGNSGQVIGVLDQGIDVLHTELDSKFTTLGPYQGGITIDDTLVDWRIPLNGHGTKVTGAMVAETNNSAGVAGLNWLAKVYSIKFMTLSTTVFNPAIKHADSLGLKFLNISYGATLGLDAPAGDYTISPMSLSAYCAWAKDMIIVGAKGNNNVTTFHIPSDLSTVIGVGGVFFDNSKLPSSNWGDDIRISGPASPFQTTQTNNSYAFEGGTSMAAPLVTATLSLMRAANDSLTADEVEEMMYMTAMKEAGDNLTGYDAKTGHGSLHAGRAVQMAATKAAVRFGGTYTSLTLDGAPHIRRFYQNHGYTGGLQTRTYTDVQRYIASRTFTYTFNNDSLRAVIRRRSTIGWPKLDHPDSTREIAYAYYDTVTATNGQKYVPNTGVTVRTAAYYIPNNGANYAPSVGWWPCKNPPCVNAPDIDLQVSILTCKNAGDVDNTCDVTIGDVAYLVAYIFEGAPAPLILDDADPDSSCDISIGDAAYIIAHIFSGGAPPKRSDCVYGSLKLTPTGPGDGFALTDKVGLTVGARAVDSALPISANCQRRLNALDITLRALNGSQLEVANKTKLELFWSQNGEIVRIGLIDKFAKNFIEPGARELLSVKGDFEFVDVRATDIVDSGKVEMIRPQFVRGKFTSGASGASDIRAISFDAVYPNPGNPEMKLTFSLPQAATVTLEIYNTLGQKVRTLTNASFEAGHHSVIWDSRDDAGSAVASGVYFARFISGDYTNSKKMLILK